MKKRSSLFLLVSLLLFGCLNNQGNKAIGTEKNNYTLKAALTGFPDSTIFYVSENNVLKDSVVLIDGEFTLEGELEHSTSIFLITNEPRVYTTLWLEAGKLSLEGDKDNFFNAIVKGSALNNTKKELQKRLAPIEAISDSLTNILMQQSMGRIKMPADVRKKMIQEYQATEQKYVTANQEFIKEHPSSYVSLKTLDVYKTTWGKSATESLFGPMPEELKASPYGKNIQEYLDLAKSVEVGDPFTDFSMPSASGNEIKLSDIKDKYVLLEFWASWCAPCREENPQLVKTYNQFKDKGFEILGVSLDIDKENWLDAIQNDGLSWPNVSDLKGDQNAAGLMYGVSGIPDNFLINPEGLIVERNLRGENLRKKLGEVFSVKD